MKPLELARQYMKIFYDSGSVEGLVEILSEDCTFRGPFHEFDTAESYINALKTDPPVEATCTILESYENENSACLVYEFSKPGISTIMSQTFVVSNGKISGIQLIFDSAAFN